MVDSTEGKRKGGSRWALVGLVLIALSLWAASGIMKGLYNDEPITWNTSTAVVFKTVRNDCGVCGTDDPVGGWESENGRSLILNESKMFVADFGDGSSMRGNWVKAGSTLCLLPAAGGKVCFDYDQKVDAMKLDDAIYIRR